MKELPLEPYVGSVQAEFLRSLFPRFVLSVGGDLERNIAAYVDATDEGGRRWSFYCPIRLGGKRFHPLHKAVHGVIRALLDAADRARDTAERRKKDDGWGLD